MFKRTENPQYITLVDWLLVLAPKSRGPKHAFEYNVGASPPPPVPMPMRVLVQEIQKCE